MGSLPGLMQTSMTAVQSWATSYSMEANAKKTKDMVISCRKDPVNPPPLMLNGQPVERVKKFKLLGVTVTSDLTWDEHVKGIISKVQPRIHYLRLAKKYGLPSDVLLSIYTSFIRPVMEYGSPVWGGLPKTLSNELEKIQKLCCKIIGTEHQQLHTLEFRRHEASLRELQRILKDTTHPCRLFLPPVVQTPYNLRRRTRLKPPLSRSNRHKNSFTPSL
ncbi:hypothetical protein Bbelb_402060 [Branchiostoma belcheri]|nr:hypothetical protein Bbelb_402060 [Branchiostoma belcheri]